MEAITSFVDQYGALMAQGTWDTVVMTVLSTAFAYVIGIPLGVLLILTAPGGLHPHRVFNSVLGWLVNIGRSIPFIILIVFMIPMTRAIVGTSLGVAAAIVPLTVAAAPFVARMVEQSLAEIDGGLVEAAQSFGASTWQIIRKVFLVESLPSLIRGLSITFITLFGFVAMAGTVGAGGIGDIAIRYGYQRYQDDVMVVAIVLCIVVVQFAQSLANVIARKIDHRSR
ncbi:MAG: methionine ABC transporter permease [Slackia sp.]